MSTAEKEQAKQDFADVLIALWKLGDELVPLHLHNCWHCRREYICGCAVPDISSMDRHSFLCPTCEDREGL